MECIQCLYPCKTICFFHHIFVLHNHVKSHTLLFDLTLVLTVVNRQVYSQISTFFFFISIATTYFVKSFWCDNLFLILNNSLLISVVTNLISLCFLTFFMIFPKTTWLINLKKSFSKLFFTCFLKPAFKSIYVFSQTLWLNLITL